MKRRLLFVVVAGTMMSAFVSCSNTVSAGGGTGTETVNTFAMRPDGLPASGAVAQIIDARWWLDSIRLGASPVIGQAIADNKGHIRLTYPSHQGRVNLQIDHADAGVLMMLPAPGSTDADTVRLQPYSSFTGSVDSGQGCTTCSIVLAGSSYRQTVGEAGIFSMVKVAPGPYAILCISGTLSSTVITGSTALTLGAGAAVNDITIPLQPQRLLIDNFESGIGPTSLGSIFPVLGWYVLSDSLYYLWDTAAQRWKEADMKRIGTTPVSFDSTADVKGGKAFRIKTVLDPVSPYANALIGFSLKPISPDGLDLTSMSGFSFRASGSGVVQIHFETHDLDSASSLQSHYSYQFKLTSAMNDFSIPVDSMRIFEPVSYAAAHPWLREAKRVLRIEFEFPVSANKRGEPLSLVLDDFYLEGVSIASLAGKQ